MFFVPWSILIAWLQPLPETVQAQVDAAIELGFDGIVVYVDQPGEPAAYYAAGWHDRDARIPADPHALFKIGSVYKLYTAVSVAKLAHAGRLSLDASVADYLPELEGRIQHADRITLRMLVQHRSGIPNYTDVPGFYSATPPSEPEPGPTRWPLSMVLDQPADFAPDARYAYSNTNYLLIRRLIDKELGYSHHQYTEEAILTPLGLTDTYSSIQDIDMAELMSGYYVGIDEDIKSSDYRTMVASAEDVGVFLRALNDGSVFAGGEQEIYSSLYVYEHTGLVPGYQTHASYLQDIDTVVVQVTTTTDFTGYNWSFADLVHRRIGTILRHQQ